MQGNTERQQKNEKFRPRKIFNNLYNKKQRYNRKTDDNRISQKQTGKI